MSNTGSSNPKILIVDDEETITSNLSTVLKRAGFDTLVAVDGAEGLELVKSHVPDLIVLDVLMPHVNGREMLRTLRTQSNWTAVILLTQIGDSLDRTMALSEGADDYLNKPFDPHELIARIEAVLRRVRPGVPPLIAAKRIGDNRLVLDRMSRRVWLDSQEIALTTKAFSILEYLMTHPDELVNRERLLNTIWGWDYLIGGRVVDTRIAELRKALQDDHTGPRFIETIPGQGYRFIGTVNPLT